MSQNSASHKRKWKCQSSIKHASLFTLDFPKPIATPNANSEARSGKMLTQEQTAYSPLTGSWSVMKSDVFSLTRSQSLAKNDAVKSEVEQ